VGGDRLLELANQSAQFVGHSAVRERNETVGKPAVLPKLAVTPRLKAVPALELHQPVSLGDVGVIQATGVPRDWVEPTEAATAGVPQGWTAGVMPSVTVVSLGKEA
jgi:hypothetical protein